MVPKPVQNEELQDEAQRILPIYLAVDRSWSMKDDGKIDAANELVPSIVDACLDNPVAEERSRFCLIAFNDEAEVIAPLSKGSDLPEDVALVPSSGTSYTNVFRLLRERIEADYQMLKADGAKVYRPAVFMITDGEPICNDSDRKKAFDELTAPEFAAFPLISLFGVGTKVSKETLTKYVWRNPETCSDDDKVTGEVILSRKGVSPGDALAGFISDLMLSMVATLKDAPSAAVRDEEDSFAEIKPIDPSVFVDYDLAT